MPSRFAGTVNAPDFPADAEWVNVPRAPSPPHFPGKLVVLDFWTFC